MQEISQEEIKDESGPKLLNVTGISELTKSFDMHYTVDDIKGARKSRQATKVRQLNLLTEKVKQDQFMDTGQNEDFMKISPVKNAVQKEGLDVAREYLLNSYQTDRFRFANLEQSRPDSAGGSSGSFTYPPIEIEESRKVPKC